MRNILRQAVVVLGLVAAAQAGQQPLPYQDSFGQEFQLGPVDLYKQARQLAQELLQGKSVVVRLYRNFRTDPHTYEEINVPLEGFDVPLESVRATLVRIASAEAAKTAGLDLNRMLARMLLVVVPEGQKEPSVAALLEGRVYNQSIPGAQRFSIWPEAADSRRFQWCVFKDAVNEPIRNVVVEVMLSSRWCSPTPPGASIGKARLDQEGRLQLPRIDGFLTSLSFIVSHPDYGEVRATFFASPRQGELYGTCFVPALPKDKWCVFTDALGNPIPNATVEIYDGPDCDHGPPAFQSRGKLDEKGRLRPPSSNLKFARCSFVVSEPSYGIALVEPQWYNMPIDVLLTGFRLPLVRIETREDERCIWGVVVDPNGKPIPNAILICNRISTPGGGIIGLPQPPYTGMTVVRPPNTVMPLLAKVLTDREGRFAMYLPIESDPNQPVRLVPPGAKYQVSISAPKERGLEQYSGPIPCGQETTITLQFTKPALEKAEIVIENETGPVTDPCMLEQVKINIRVFADNGMTHVNNYTYYSYRQNEIAKVGSYSAEAVWNGTRYASEPVEVTIDGPKTVVLKLVPVGPYEITYRGRVVHGITGDPIADAFVMRRPHISDFDQSKLDFNEMNIIFRSIGPELVPGNPNIRLFGRQVNLENGKH